LGIEVIAAAPARSSTAFRTIFLASRPQENDNHYHLSPIPPKRRCASGFG
jgi:hypothetical protein